MKLLKETRFGKAFGKKGLLITLGTCILAAGGVGLAAYNRTVDNIGESLNLALNDSKSITENVLADANESGVEMEDSSDLSSDSTDNSSDSEITVITQPYVMPVNGEIIKPFSNGELVKSETLGVWKTHDGADIKADAGTQVKAINQGTVTKVWDDPLWGTCITIDHGNGIESHYYNLSQATTVIEGDEVNSGEVIGAVGDTAEIEAAEGSHLHFAVKRNGSWIDPISFIDPNSNK